jgi:hypothetical protein
MPMRSLLAAALFATVSGAALAQTAPAPAAPAAPSMPGGDIFGLTSSSDTGNPGDRGIAFETSSRAGRDSGGYWFTTLKTQLSATIAPNLAVAISPFVTYMSIQNSALYNPAGRAEFDGLSGEVTWRFLERGALPIAAALSIEPRYARVDANAGGRVEAWSAEAKLFVDAIVVPDRLFAALNVNVAPGTTNVSFALATPLHERVSLGLEARWLAAYQGAWLNQMVGNALFVGPNLLFRLTDTANLNIAWTPQISGNAVGVPGRADLTNFERHQLRVKLAVGF